MKIVINDMEWIPSGDAQDDKKRIWKEITEEVSARGEVISSLEANGEEMLPEAFVEIAGDYDFVVRTKPIRLLIRESLEEATRYLPALFKGYETIADKFEGEEKKEALEMLQQALEGNQWFLGVTQNCQVLLGEETDFPDTDASRKDMAEALRKMEEALEGERFFEVAFLIREELLPLISRFQGYVEQLSSLAASEIQ